MEITLLQVGEAIWCMFAGLVCALCAAIFVSSKHYVMMALAMTATVMTITHSILILTQA